MSVLGSGRRTRHHLRRASSAPSADRAVEPVSQRARAALTPKLSYAALDEPQAPGIKRSYARPPRLSCTHPRRKGSSPSSVMTPTSDSKPPIPFALPVDTTLPPLFCPAPPKKPTSFPIVSADASSLDADAFPPLVFPLVFNDDTHVHTYACTERSPKNGSQPRPDGSHRGKDFRAHEALVAPRRSSPLDSLELVRDY